MEGIWVGMDDFYVKIQFFVVIDEFSEDSKYRRGQRIKGIVWIRQLSVVCVQRSLVRFRQVLSFFLGLNRFFIYSFVLYSFGFFLGYLRVIVIVIRVGFGLYLRVCYLFIGLEICFVVGRGRVRFSFYIFWGSSYSGFRFRFELVGLYRFWFFLLLQI